MKFLVGYCLLFPQFEWRLVCKYIVQVNWLGEYDVALQNVLVVWLQIPESIMVSDVRKLGEEPMMDP